MLLRLFVLFVGLPLVELALLIQVGRWIGLWPTLAIVVSTGLAGAALARSEGFRVLHALQTEVAAGRMPGRAVLDGACVLVGGAVLLTPGILTDILGFALLVPFTRRRIQDVILRRLRRQVEEGEVQVTILRSRPLDSNVEYGPLGRERDER